jgi:hypothetical protein
MTWHEKGTKIFISVERWARAHCLISRNTKYIRRKEHNFLSKIAHGYHGKDYQP